jgi:hypothetical protein
VARPFGSESVREHTGASKQVTEAAENTLSKKVTTALDETRLLILGAQVLFGFQLQAVFQEQFKTLPLWSRYLECGAQLLMTISVACLVAPSMLHRISERGEDSPRIQQAATLCAGIALMPFALSIGFDLFIVFQPIVSTGTAVAAGVAFFLMATTFWYVLAFLMRQQFGEEPMPREQPATPLATKIENMLREARVILPGAQALLGFQLVVTLTRAFSELSPASKALHLVALCSVALATILLMTPAALHRITFGGENTEQFLHVGSGFVIAAPVFLGIGIVLDLYVATVAAVASDLLGLTLALGAFAILGTLWYGLPLAMRHNR